jgi:hypothetical protein
VAKVYCYYRPATESGGSSQPWPSAGGYLMNFGHFLIEVEKGGRRIAFDYYLKDGHSVVDTALGEGRNREHLYLSFFISDTVADRMVSRIKEFARNPPAYEFPFTSTCISRSNEILNLAGLGVHGAMTPAGLWDGLIDKSLRGTQQIWRDRSDERIVFPREFMPQRHGVPLPPPSEQAWMAGQARRWQQQLMQQQQVQQVQQQQAQQVQQQQHAHEQLMQQLLNIHSRFRPTPKHAHIPTGDSGHRPGLGFSSFENPFRSHSGSVVVHGSGGGHTIGGPNLVNEIHSRFRATPHRVPLGPQSGPGGFVQVGTCTYTTSRGSTAFQVPGRWWVGR